jgi:hypothetical protein
MRKVIAQEWMSLDGVVQAPSGPGEDTSGGFTQGGWHLPYLDETAMRWVISSISLGSGKRAFPDCGTAQPMQLTSSQVTTTGAIIASYSRP